MGKGVTRANPHLFRSAGDIHRHVSEYKADGSLTLRRLALPKRQTRKYKASSNYMT